MKGFEGGWPGILRTRFPVSVFDTETNITDNTYRSAPNTFSRRIETAAVVKFVA